MMGARENTVYYGLTKGSNPQDRGQTVYQKTFS